MKMKDHLKFPDQKFPLYMMASIDEDVEKSSLTDQDDVGSGVSARYASTSHAKIDFAKAYDSIRWDYLGDVLKSFGFGVKWSVRIESLHLSFSRVIEAGIFTGIKIDSSTTLSHLFYADDAVFIGEWSRDLYDRLHYSVKLQSGGFSFPIFCPICCEALENLILCCFVRLDKRYCSGTPYFLIGGAWFGTLLIRIDLGYLGLIWFSFNQVQNKCSKECFTLPGGVSGDIETISSSLIQIFEKMVFLKT
ncbi:hypothetical protein Tco_0489230 [Tanacetum coccineum]